MPARAAMSTPVTRHDGLAGEPSRWVRHWAHLVAAGGAVLDVASGAGRHARLFASRGHPVTALDRDAAALGTMRDEPLITTLAADLEGARVAVARRREIRRGRGDELSAPAAVSAAC